MGSAPGPRQEPRGPWTPKPNVMGSKGLSAFGGVEGQSPRLAFLSTRNLRPAPGITRPWERLPPGRRSRRRGGGG